MVPLMFQMVNNGVHWWSDYPLGLFIGYTVGKVVAGRWRQPAAGKAGLAPEVTPVAFAGGTGAALVWRY